VLLAVKRYLGWSNSERMALMANVKTLVSKSEMVESDPISVLYVGKTDSSNDEIDDISAWSVNADYSAQYC